MAAVGVIALAIGAVGIVLGAFVAARSVPDLRRYRRLRRM